MTGKASNIELMKHIQGRSILEKVIPTVCSLERMLENIIVCNGDYNKLKAWEKSCYRAYRLETVLSKLLDAGISERIEIIKENLLSLKSQELGPNGIDIYLVAYVAEKYGSGKNVFGRFIMESGISDKQNSVNAIWQVGKRDGIYLGLLNEDGTIKNWSFFEEWLAGAKRGCNNLLDKSNTSVESTINEEKRCTFNKISVRKIADYVSKGCYKEDYLKEKNVIDFLDWLDGKLDPASVFNHSYYLAKAKQNWQCSSLYEAYENYWWDYNICCNLNGNRIQGSNFSQSFQYMEYLSSELRNAVKNGNFELAAKASLSMLSWGGVLLGNQKRIEELGSQICNYYNYVQESLNLNMQEK